MDQTVDAKRKLALARKLEGANKLAQEFGVVPMGEIADPERELALALKANSKLVRLLEVQGFLSEHGAPREMLLVLFEIASDIIEAVT